MRMRVDLHLVLTAILQEVLQTDIKNDHLYYQAPPSVKMKYPAIRYERRRIENEHADNLTYKQDCSYEIMVIDKDPDSLIVTKVSQLPRCRHERHYTADNLNHDIFTIYF